MSEQPAHKHTVVVVGGGAGGLAVASKLKRRRPELDVAVIEPAEDHYYQPAWTLVGGGVYPIEATRRREADIMPRGVRWIKARVADFEPKSNRVILEDGAAIEYAFLVVAVGIQLNWGAIEGLKETLGRNGVASNYDGSLAPYTWECIRNFRGGRALFTQPAMPIKCPGAPQKILYLAADHFRRRGINADLNFFNPGAAMFGVPFFAKALDKVIDAWGGKRNFGHTLVAVDGPRKLAVFEVSDGKEKKRVTYEFEMLHVVPPQSAPEFIRNSPLADQGGWMAVDKHTLRHASYENIFGLGDCTNTPNSKTAAAVKNQAPVLVANLLRALEGKGGERTYDGYASCPLTTSLGKVMLAEFCYDGVVTPSFVVDPRVPRAAFWRLKKSFLPYLYWQFIVPGKEWPIVHKRRDYSETLPAFTP
jgi:sulfide:quinone oxidoreductase